MKKYQAFCTVAIKYVHNDYLYGWDEYLPDGTDCM